MQIERQKRSSDYYQLAQTLLPAGVSSPVRAWMNVDAKPKFIDRGEGPYLYDVDGNRYIDYVCSWGPLILGHAHPYVKAQVLEALSRGFTFGAPTQVELELADQIRKLMPSIEMLRFVSSGTEAAMSAIRLARGVTQRNKIIKFAGCYHGHADSLLVAAGSGNLTFGVPSSAGVPDAVVADTLVCEFNNLLALDQVFEKYGEQIAAIIVEPVAANMNLVLPHAQFLPGLRTLCDRYGSLLIFDEVITGFRVALGGAQSYYQIEPDLTILGKIIGGGFPAAAFGGKRHLMSHVAPLGPVYQAGTLSGNPIAMTAGLATLHCLQATHCYETLAAKTHTLVSGIETIASSLAFPLQVCAIGSMFGLFFTTQQSIRNEHDVKQCDPTLFKTFFHAMLAQGIYLAPSPYEVGFVSSAHGDEEIAATLAAIKHVLTKMRGEVRF